MENSISDLKTGKQSEIAAVYFWLVWGRVMDLFTWVSGTIQFDHKDFFQILI
jgi:hypothetical protein